MRSAIGSVHHAPTEMVLTSRCADVSKLMCHMRINGDILDKDLLVACSCGPVSALRSTGTCRTTQGGRPPTGVTCGGLGLRTALGIALPALVAGRIM